MDCPSFNGDGGGDLGFEGDCIGEVNGVADWTLTGLGQDVLIRDRVDGGKGTLTLRKFGNITVQEKNGVRTLVVEDNNKSVTFNVVNGAGNTFLRNSGLKKIQSKNGSGNVFFQGDPPFVHEFNGSGKLIREGQ
jgi:hypothetical protein